MINAIALEELFLHEMQLGAFVTWSKHDNDVEKGHPRVSGFGSLGFRAV